MDTFCTELDVDQCAQVKFLVTIVYKFAHNVKANYKNIHKVSERIKI